MKRKHFHTFDALRFFSFLLVFLLHLPKSGIPAIDFFCKSGGIGVSFFFVLSGFLITYILLFEKETEQQISLYNFFARRILRIWPLFYAMIAFAYLSPYLLSIFNLPSNNEGYEPQLLWSVLFAENYMMMATDSFPNGAPLRVMWSLCIEEHFYIFWGVSLYFISRKRIPHLVVGAIIIATFSRLIYSHYDLSHVDLFTNLDYFAFGAIPAYILVYHPHYIKKSDSVAVELKYILLLLTITTVFIAPHYNREVMRHLWPTIFGILFSGIIFLTLGNNPIYISDNLWISQLGKYTYGLYLFHTIIILTLLKVLESNWFVIFTLGLSLCIGSSLLSYHLFEKQFLKLKRYFYN